MYKFYNLIIMLTMSGSCFAMAAEDVLRDPTQPQSSLSYKTTATDQVTNEIKIDAIFSGKNHKVALIEDNLYTVGDKILDSTITAIDAHAVKLRNEQGEFEVAMPYSSVKTPTTIIKKKSDREKLE